MTAPTASDAAVDAASDAARRSAKLHARPARGAALVLARGMGVVAAPEVPDRDNVGVGTCAERVAVYEALSCRPDSAPALAIRTVVLRGGPRGTSDAGPPCGACLQVLVEFSPRARVFWGTTRRPLGGETVAELLPGAFDRAHLGGRAPARSRANRG